MTRDGGSRDLGHAARTDPELGSLEVTIVAHDIGEVGGMERQIRELVLGCLDRGCRVTVIARSCDVPAHERLAVHLVAGPSRPFALAYPWFAIAGGILLHRLRRGVVHTAGAIVAARVDVVTVHFCHRAYRELARGSRASRDSLPYRLNALAASTMSRASERWALRRSRARSVVAVSRGVRDELERWFPALAGRVLTIPHGVDQDRFRPDAGQRAATRERWGLADGDHVALFVGGDWPRKGLPHAIRAVAAAGRWHLVVVGEGDREHHRRLAESLGVGERVLFDGTSAEPAREFAAADAFILPTDYETFSLVTYEAAATGLPLLVSRVNGPDELIVDGVNGFFLDRDHERTGRLLRQLGDDPQQRRSMGSAALEAVRRYTWTAAVDAHLALYAKLASGAG